MHAFLFFRVLASNLRLWLTLPHIAHFGDSQCASSWLVGVSRKCNHHPQALLGISECCLLHAIVAAVTSWCNCNFPVLNRPVKGFVVHVVCAVASMKNHPAKNPCPPQRAWRCLGNLARGKLFGCSAIKYD